MPLRDHFHRPWCDENPWEGFHSAWVNTMVRHLNGPVLPQQFRASPRVHPIRATEIECDPQDTFEVRVYDGQQTRRLVAVVELVSPGNKDRPEQRQAFVAKCASYLHHRVGVVVVDIVTTRRANLHAELLELFSAPAVQERSGDLYCVSYRPHPDNQGGAANRGRLSLWPFALAVGSPLPTVPLWLGELAVPLDLEGSYLETCRVLRLA